jgi:hypothetical protein
VIKTVTGVSKNEAPGFIFRKGSISMANNRIRFKCNVCGESMPLAKSVGGGYYLSPAFKASYLDDFLYEHAFCNANGTKESEEGDFSLEYEFPIHDEKEDNQNGKNR